MPSTRRAGWGKTDTRDGTIETGIAKCEDSSVRTDQPIATLVGCRRDANDWPVQPQVSRAPVESG